MKMKRGVLKKISNMAGIHPTYLSMILNRQRVPTYAVANQLKNLTGTNVLEWLDPETYGRETIEAALTLPVPTIVEIVSRPEAARISWDPIKDDRVAGVRVYWGRESGKYDDSEVAEHADSHVLYCLSGGGEWFFTVRAFNEAGQLGPFSAEIKEDIPLPEYQDPHEERCETEVEPLPAPILRNVYSIEPGALSVYWDDAEGSVAGYEVCLWRNKEADGEPECADAGDELDFCWENLPSGMAMRMAVRAYDVNGARGHFSELWNCVPK